MKLEKKNDQLNLLGIRVLAISAGEPEDSNKTKNKTGGIFTFVSDPSGDFIEDLGLLDRAGNPFNGSDAARISKLLVDKEKNVLWYRFTENNRVRIKSSELISELKKSIQSQ